MRTIHPEFWEDKGLRGLNEATRLTYIGLWQLADDVGWLDWDPDIMSLKLHPWDDHDTRLARFMEDVAPLVERARVVIHECGHASLPTMPRYQKSGRPMTKFRDAHRRCEAIRSNPAQSGQSAHEGGRGVVVGEGNSRVEGAGAASPSQTGNGVDWAQKVAEMAVRGAQPS